MTRPRSPMLVNCGMCLHVWPVVWMPCPVDLIGKVIPAVCPWCGCDDRKQITLANASDVRRYAFWLETEQDRARNEVESLPKPPAT